MSPLQKLYPFIKPYWKFAGISLLLLMAVVGMDLAIPRLVERIIDEGIARNDTAVVIQTALIMLTVSALSTLFAVGNNYYSVRAGESVARDMREALFLKIQSFSYGNLDRFTTGKLLVRLSSDTSAVQRLVQISLRIGTRAPLLMIGSLILMINTDATLAFQLFPLLAVTALVIVFFSLRMEPLYRAVQLKLDALNTVLQENIAGARVVKAFVRADYENQRFAAANADFTTRNIRVMQFMASMSPILSTFVNVGMVVVIWSGGAQAIRGELTIGQIVAFTNYMLTTMGPLTMMAMLANIWANGFASLQRIHEVLDTVPDVQAAANAHPLPASAHGRVVFEHVSFQYNDSLVLDNLSFTAEPGQMVAILGATGSGKTSLVNLIPRFYDVTQGRVLLDGVDLRDLQPESLVGHIAVVPQETILFSGSVRENLRYGRPAATEDEIVTAAKAAQAHDFILKLPRGYDTHVEERGVNLSGGQKQRLAIARALVTRPKLLILDDSTSAVDVETEIKIQAALSALLRGCTTFVVAQRLSTVLNADKILVIDDGRLAAEGTHRELLETSAIYREIYDSQLGGGLSEAELLASTVEVA